MSADRCGALHWWVHTWHVSDEAVIIGSPGIGSRPDTRRLPAAMRSGVAWGVAVTVLVIPTFAAIWSLNGRGRFWPATALVAVIGFGAGWWMGWRGRPLPNEFVERHRHVLFVALYPLAVAIGVLFAQPGFSAFNRCEWIVIAVGIGSIAVLCNAMKNGRVVLRRWGWGWSVITVLLFPIYGLGLVFLPLAVGYRVAARHGGIDST